jgi:geranylgeranyl diphosphate synthase type I
MKFHEYSQEMLPELEEEILSSIEKDIPDSYPDLQKMMKYHFGWNEMSNGKSSQGKRIRPLLVLLSSMVCGCEWRKALPGAVSIELIHNFSLIHDDIEDQSTLRRGRETLWKVFGMAQALNTGDAMFSLAQINMLKLGNKINKSVGFDSVQLLNETCLTLTGGQNLDIAFEERDIVTEDEYFVMIGGKTAALLSTSCELGAIIAQSSNVNRLALHSFGEALGLAFQAWDDWLGIWGDEQSTGKSTSSDLISRKKTLPILYAIQKSHEFEDKFLNGTIDEKNINEYIRLIEETGAKEYTEKIAKYYSNLAEKSIKSIHTTNTESLEALIELSSQLLNRKN